MKFRIPRPTVLAAAVLAGLLAGVLPAAAAPTYAIAMHGDPALPAGFTHFPYADPDAPKGGGITYGVIGTFDSLNPFILSSMRTTARGLWDPEFGNLVYEPLMQRSADEPFTLYGLLAEKVEMDPDRKWIEFTLNPKARWSDGVPVTPDDVIFTFKLLAEKGRPPYSSRMDRIQSIEKVGDNGVRFTFKDDSDREFPLIIAMSPVLPEHTIDPKTFDQSTLKAPIGSGPYTVAEVDPGSRIVYKRNPDYWGKDIPSKRGFDNFDRITVDYFRNETTRFEAFKKGLFDVYPEADPTRWDEAYGFPAVRDGKVLKEAFKTETPASMYGFIFNTRRPIFKNRVVREGLSKLFDFEWTNRNLFDGLYKRTASFWQGSTLSAYGRPATPAERTLLAPYPGSVQPDVMDGTYKPEVTDGSGHDRNAMLAGFKLLESAGCRIDGEHMVGPDGRPFGFEILTRTADQERLALAYQRTLDRLGIAVRIRSVDDAQYQQRLQTFDYDMILASYSASLSPGNEQIGRWASMSRNERGSFNYAGADSPAIDAMIGAMLKAKSQEDFVAAVRALDRVLISGHYVVPLFHVDEQWVAYWARVRHPAATPIYGYQLPTWWAQPGG
jgi:peptide/nickel transport system substrate-binding protein